MTQEQKDKWIEALDSGLYNQTRHTFFNECEGKSFCALGVLADINNRIDLDPVVIMEWIGTLLNRNTANTIITLNDTYKYNFHQIATWIWENVEVEDVVR